jgi:CRP/FNR family cyclic AMP-dependent transcriptional regulator
MHLDALAQALLNADERAQMTKSNSQAGPYAYRQLLRIGLSDARAKLVSNKLKIHAYDANQRICTKGQQLDYWHLIMTGLVSASTPVSETDCVPISLYGECSWFGEQSIINKKPSYANYVCLTSTDVLSLPASMVHELLEEEPQFSNYLAKLVAWRAQRASEMLMLMKLGNPALRVVMGLSQFIEALAYQSERPPTIGFGEGIQLPLTQGAVAALCGVSRSTFSDVAQKLAAEGWVRLAYGQVEILEHEAWSKFSQKQRTRNFNNLNPKLTELLDDLRASSKL